MKYPDNRNVLEALPIQIFGFIFYPPSPRFVDHEDMATLRKLTDTLKNKAGVFVDATIDHICTITELAGLTYVQLHGNETPGFCRKVRNSGIRLIKAFRVDESFDFTSILEYSETVDFFLFDTKAEKPGGTGQKFNWKLLENYRSETPFFLSGGIKPEDAEQIKKIEHPQFYGIDLNSGFEDKPGLKNFEQLSSFLHRLNNPKL